MKRFPWFPSSPADTHDLFLDAQERASRVLSAAVARGEISEVEAVALLAVSSKPPVYAAKGEDYVR